jgi:flagellar assembly factor FliW
MTHAIAADEIVTFADGLPGFEQYRRFVLVASSMLSPFTLIQGLDEGAPSFVAIDPQLVDRNYVTALDGPDLARLQADAGRPLLWLALITPRGEGDATVNLRAPLVINPSTMRGIQFIPPDSPYRIDHPLAAA